MDLSSVHTYSTPQIKNSDKLVKQVVAWVQYILVHALHDTWYFLGSTRSFSGRPQVGGMQDRGSRIGKSRKQISYR